jgi:hypothetical protein
VPDGEGVSISPIKLIVQSNQDTSVTAYYCRERELEQPRLQPYVAASQNQSGYLDLRAQPHLIRSALEDFRPFEQWPAVETFYSLLEWLRRPESALDSTDCAFRPPAPHSDSNSHFALSAHGRLFLMFHDAKLNISQPHTVWLCGRMMGVLQEIDTDFEPSRGVVGLTLNPVLHTDLSPARWINDGLYEHGPDDPGVGAHLMLSFWGYGNDDEQVFGSLDRVWSNVRRSCESVSAEIRQATAAS